MTVLITRIRPSGTSSIMVSAKSFLDRSRTLSFQPTQMGSHSFRPLCVRPAANHESYGQCVSIHYVWRWTAIPTWGRWWCRSLQHSPNEMNWAEDDLPCPMSLRCWRHASTGESHRSSWAEYTQRRSAAEAELLMKMRRMMMMGQGCWWWDVQSYMSRR